MGYPLVEANVDNNIIKTKQYKPDLSEMLSQCELNYWLLKQLLPELASCNEALVNDKLLVRKVPSDNVWDLHAKTVKLRISVTETVRYTTTLKFVISTPKIPVNRYIELIVRIYHDAKMLEVMEGCGPAAMLAVYPQEDPCKRPVDEKRQANRFIGECLKACSNKMKSKIIDSGVN